MAYGGIMLTSCREPPRQFKHLRVLIVEEDGEYGTGDCNAKMADWLFEEFGQQGHRFRAGQFRLLAEREPACYADRDGSGMVVVGKGTIKRMDHQDVDERGQPYDLILPESSLKGNSPSPGEYVWDTTHLGFNAWNERRRVKFSYQYLQWLSPDTIRALFPRVDSKVEILKEAMTSTEGARKLLRIARKEPLEQSQEIEEKPVPELLEALAGQEMDEEEEFRILDTILAGDQSDVMVHHPYVRHKLRQIMRRVWHDLAIGGGVEVLSFTWQPDSFRDKMDWIPLRHIICPELPDGEVASFRYPIRTKHDDQVWYNLTSVEAMRKRGEELTSRYREYEANHRDALKRAEYAGPTPARQRKIQAAQEEMATLQAQLEEARKPVEPPARGTPEYWTWRPEMLQAKQAEQQETISRLQAQIEELAQRVEELHTPTDYQARKMRKARREAGEWQRRMQEEAESERYQAGLQLLELAGDKDTRAFFGYARQHKGVAYLSHQTAALVGGDFDGDTGQHIPLPKPREGQSPYMNSLRGTLVPIL